MKLRILAIASMAALTFTACEGEDAVEDTRLTGGDLLDMAAEREREDSEADLEVAAILMTWVPGDVCPYYRDMLDMGADQSMIDLLALDQYEEGYGDRLTDEGRETILDLLHDCL